MFCVGKSKWALLRVQVSTELVQVLGTACRWQSMWVNNQPYARPSRMYINAGRCVGACFTAETLGYNWCISLLSAWFDGIFEDALYPFIFYFLFFFIFWVAGQVKLSSKEMLSLGLGARIKVDDWFAASMFRFSVPLLIWTSPTFQWKKSNSAYDGPKPVWKKRRVKRKRKNNNNL